jgi:serine/threonine-protein kinase
MLLDEARLASRFRHANVAATVDVVSGDGELWLVMDYVHGASLRELIAAASLMGGLDPRVVAAVAVGALHGLHAAHEATTETGEPLGVVHRDVSPQNILVGKDGLARVVDFGVAKAIGRLQHTNAGQFKGKPRYMAPEALRGDGTAIDRRTDVFGMGAVVWEALTGRPLFDDESKVDVLMQVLTMPIPSPETVRPSVPKALGDVVLRALRRDPGERYATAEQFAIELEASLPNGLASQHAVGSVVQRLVGERLRDRELVIAAIERTLPGDHAGAERVLATTGPAETAKPADDPLDGPTLRQGKDVLADALDAPTVQRRAAPAAAPAAILRTERIDMRSSRPIFASDGNTVRMSPEKTRAPGGSTPPSVSKPFAFGVSFTGAGIVLIVALLALLFYLLRS